MREHENEPIIPELDNKTKYKEIIFLKKTFNF